MTTIGIIGSGHVGSNPARAATAHGYDVVLSGSQGSQALAGPVADLAIVAITRSQERRMSGSLQ